jgi:sterol desaturase/sphingolipid hydroxylase (fatty acid hydroxylase superfamily)
MIQKLGNLQPFILLFLLIFMYSIENVWPYLAKPVNRKYHDIQNFILTFLSIIVNGAVGVAVVYSVVYTNDHQLGLFNLIHLPASVEIIANVLLLDLISYGFHNLLHRVPLFWRFHRVHHSDLNLNTTSSLRFHPIEVVVSQGLLVMFGILVTGASITTFIIYSTIGLIFVIIQHSNIRFPDWFEKYARYIFSTPGWHKIHHSNDQRLTDSHYGDIFTFWDRIFNTWRPTRPEDIRYGLKEFESKEKQNAFYLLKSPFVDITK